jgi:hypothetical protein
LFSASAIGGRRRCGGGLKLLTQLLNQLVRSSRGAVGGSRRGLCLVSHSYRLGQRALGGDKILLGFPVPVGVGPSRRRGCRLAGTALRTA